MKILPESVSLQLDPAKQRFINKRFGSIGSAWIRDFPELIQACLSQWGLTLIGRAETGLAVNTVFFVQRGEQVCVLKVGLPQPEQLTEIEALGLFSSDQVVNVLAWDEPKRALLMERESSLYFASFLSSSLRRAPIFFRASLVETWAAGNFSRACLRRSS